MIAIIIFAIAYMIKGGWLGKIKFIRDFEKKSWLCGRMVDGKVLSTIIAFLFSLVSYDFTQSLIWSVAWLIAVSPSMGEEAGAIGRIGYWWGDYKEAYSQERGTFLFDRRYGILKGVQRGAWMGAVFTVAGATTLSIPIMGLGLVAAHFIGQELYFRIHKQGQSWAYAEPLVGALIGLCVAL